MESSLNELLSGIDAARKTINGIAPMAAKLFRNSNLDGLCSLRGALDGIGTDVYKAANAVETLFDVLGEEKPPEVVTDEEGRKVTVYRAEVLLPQSEITKWNDCLRASKEELEAWIESKDIPVKVATAHFDDGCFADIKINLTNDEEDCYAEAVLFDEAGGMLNFTTDPSNEIDGTWILYAGDSEYHVLVMPKA